MNFEITCIVEKSKDTPLSLYPFVLPLLNPHKIVFISSLVTLKI